MTTDRLATSARTLLVGHVVALCAVSSVFAAPQQESTPQTETAPQQETASRSESGYPAPDCRATAAGTERSRGAAQWAAGSDRADAEQWESLAAARFMAGDVRGALDAWNRVDQPRVRCVNVEGLVRTPRAVVIDYVDASSGGVLTAGDFTRMQHRLDELPIASRSRLRYDPAGDGATTITPIIAERNVIPQGLQSWGVVGVRSAFMQEVRVGIAGPAGRGEVWTPSYRWGENRPRLMLRLDAPSPGRLPGLVHVQTFIERQTYSYEGLGDNTFQQARQRIGVSMSDWVTSWLRWEAGTAFDRIETNYLAFEGSLNARAFDDRFAAILTGGRWLGDGDRPPVSTTELVAMVRSTTKDDVPMLTGIVGMARASDSAPLALWPAVSSGDGRNGLLRAHPLRRDSVITDEVFGRHLFFSTTEFEYPFHTRVGQVGVAAFVDMAQSSQRLVRRFSSPFHVDVGTGIRFDASGTGKVRLDIGYGIRDGHVRLSAGYAIPWATR